MNLPLRENAAQGDLGDPAVIAAMGAVAGHRPEALAALIQNGPEDTLIIKLHEVRHPWPRQTRCEPTGHRMLVHVTQELPVDRSATAVYADVTHTGVTWAAYVEKALASVDQAWSEARWDDWTRWWIENAADTAPPAGYARLDHAARLADAAETLTLLTGRPAELRTLPDEPSQLAPEVNRLLAGSRPVLVATRPVPRGTRLPHRLVESQVYEIFRARMGLFDLRNPWGFHHPKPLATQDLTQWFLNTYVTLCP